MVLYVLSLVFGIIVTTVFLCLRVKKKGSKAAVAKGCASLFFILTALSAAYSSGNQDVYNYSLFIVGGLVCGLLGDIWLDLKFVYPKDGDFYTYSGFICFAAGHFLFAAGVIFGIGFSLKALLIAIAAAVIAAIGIALTEKPMKLKYGKFKLITCVYAAILFGITVLCLMTAIFVETGRMTAIVMTVGTVFFLVSDLILSGTYFGEGKDRSIDIVTNHVAYYIAQFVIASAALFIGK